MSDTLPYPSEQLQMNALVRELNDELVGRRMSEAEFAAMATERFAAIGWNVAVKCATIVGDPNGLFVPEIEVVDRIEPIEFDHERMAREVQLDVLGTGQRGAITADGTWVEPSTSTAFPDKPD